MQAGLSAYVASESWPQFSNAICSGATLPYDSCFSIRDGVGVVQMSEGAYVQYCLCHRSGKRVQGL